MAWFRREQAPLSQKSSAESRVPEGLWVKCGSCKEILYRKDVLKNLSVCPKCAFHFRVSARERLDMLFDGPWEEFDRNLVSADPLGFRDAKPYAERLRAGQTQPQDRPESGSEQTDFHCRPPLQASPAHQEPRVYTGSRQILTDS